MLPGDIVLKINGVEVKTSEEIYKAVRSCKSITMVVQRGNELLQLQVTPEYIEWRRPRRFLLHTDDLMVQERKNVNPDNFFWFNMNTFIHMEQNKSTVA